MLVKGALGFWEVHCEIAHIYFMKKFEWIQLMKRQNMLIFTAWLKNKIEEKTA